MSLLSLLFLAVTVTDMDYLKYSIIVRPRSAAQRRAKLPSCGVSLVFYSSRLSNPLACRMHVTRNCCWCVYRVY